MENRTERRENLSKRVGELREQGYTTHEIWEMIKNEKSWNNTVNNVDKKEVEPRKVELKIKNPEHICESLIRIGVIKNVTLEMYKCPDCGKIEIHVVDRDREIIAKL